MKQSFLPPSYLARGRGQSLKLMGSVRVTVEKRNLINQTNITLETLRRKSENDIRHHFTYGGSVKGSIVKGSVEKRTMIGNNKGLNAATYNQNVFAQKTNVVPPGFDAPEDETSFHSDDLKVMQETVRSKPVKENGQNMTSLCSIKGSIIRGSVAKRTMVGNNKGLNAATYNQNEVAQKTNVVPPGFDALEDETSFHCDDLKVMQETVRSKPGEWQNITSVCSIKGSIVIGSVEKRTMDGNNKGLNVATYNQNVIVQKTNVVPRVFDVLADETSFPSDDLEVIQETENGKNITSVCSVKGSNVVQRTCIGKSKNYCVPSFDKNEVAHNKNLMQPGFDPIEVDTFFPRDDLEVMGRGNRFTSLSSIRGGIGKRITIGNNKGLNSAIYDQNAIPQKTNVVCPDFDAIEVETSFPNDDHEVMQDNMRRKPGKENGKNITSVGSARGSNFVQRILIGNIKGYSVVSSDMNVLAHSKILRQPDFNPIEHDTSFPRDDLEAMQEALRSKSSIIQPSRSYIKCSPSKCTRKASKPPHVPIRTGTYCSTTDMNNVFSFCTRERAQSFTYVGSLIRCAERRTLNGKNKDSKNTEYDLNELTQNNNRVPLGLGPMEDHLTLPQDEVEVMQDTWRSKTDVPEGVDKSDWEWLVKEHFLSEKFKVSKLVTQKQSIFQFSKLVNMYKMIIPCFHS
ncbi:hypothetical protein H5410_014951 [Solanum commersonii]|uniref:Uncharacterized protein n=1 Tax=Solanum commersonii TaxID=4109 RepID=A0A9J5ZSZ6_SOLCO|nr:hypothetical protein H5410_014951 [Solanum commersonii]